MKKNKLDYEAPEANTVVVRFEGCLCVSEPTRGGIRNITGEDVNDDSDGWGN